MGRPTRRDGVPELRLSICPRISCLASPMTIVMYRQSQLSTVGATTYKMEDTTRHNLIHALSIRAVQLPPSYLTRFPDCVGQVPNSTATTLRTVKALDTGSSSRSTGHSGSGTNPTCMQFPSHYTSYLDLGVSTSLLPYLSHIRIVSPPGFYFHFKTRRRLTETTLRQLQ